MRKKLKANTRKMEVYTMANGKFLPLGERKYLSMKDMAGHLGLGFTKVKEIVRGGEFTGFITIGKSNKVMIDRVAFEKWIEERGHI